MTADEWDELVRRRAQQAKSDPRGYRVRVWAWALAGYAILLGTLDLAIAGAAWLVVVLILDARILLWLIKTGIAIGVLAVTILRALAVKLPPPSGIELRPADAPALFEAIERLHIRARPRARVVRRPACAPPRASSVRRPGRRAPVRAS
jgi:hypothetical protein